MVTCSDFDRQFNTQFPLKSLVLMKGKDLMNIYEGIVFFPGNDDTEAQIIYEYNGYIIAPNEQQARNQVMVAAARAEGVNDVLLSRSEVRLRVFC